MTSRVGIVAAVFLAAFVAIELTVQKPLVNLRLLKRRNFGLGLLLRQPLMTKDKA